MEVDVECFSYNNLIQDFKFMKIVVKIAMDIWIGRKKKMCIKDS